MFKLFFTYSVSILLVCSHLQSFGQKGSTSIFNEGRWYKIGILEPGVHRIDGGFLRDLGINLSDVDPSLIKLFGDGGGGMLPQANNGNFYELQELPIFLNGTGDGSFDNTDYLLFYGNGADKFWYDEEREVFTHEKNLYSDTAFYFLSIDGEAGARISSRESLEGDFPIITSFNDYTLYEEEVTSIRLEGRRWFGRRLNGTNVSQSINFNIEGIIERPILLESATLATATDDTYFELDINDQLVSTINFGPKPDGEYDPSGIPKTTFESVDYSDVPNVNQGLQLEVTYFPGDIVGASGYLDYLFLQFERRLALYGNQTLFRSLESLGYGTATFKIDQANSELQVWDVSIQTNPILQEYQSENGSISFATSTEQLKEFVVFDPAETLSPVSGVSISNQNILTASPPQGLIITHRNFVREANRLADFHRSHSGLDVKVVEIDEIYNEFSSGRQDITAIRNYVKYLYNLDNGETLRYLLLFGDCSYDYKKRAVVDHNFVPVYEARESMDPIYSYSSDDYYGFMEDNEGEWAETSAGDHTLEIGIGRFPVKTLEQARVLVDKVIRYETSNKVLGSWRNDIYFIADDGDSNIHMRDAVRLSNMVDTAYSNFNGQKVFLDANAQEPGPPERSEETKSQILDVISKGALIVNYTGHGNIEVWADERVITKREVRELTNRQRLPLFVTATCEFGKYDYPLADSSGEELILNPNGGAIGLITTTRPVFAHTNFVVNRAFYENVFRLEGGENPRLGDIIRRSKNGSLRGPVNRNFALLGDPMMKLAIPDYNLSVTSIRNLSTGTDTLAALSLIEVRGEVTSQLGEKMNDFNGTVTAKILDKPNESITLGNQNSPYSYEVRNTLLFNGEASIANGDFSFQFVVPKNIAYNFDKGKISLYAVSSDRRFDASGSDIDLVVGGSNPDVEQDLTPPSIEIFLNDSTSNKQKKVNENPLLFVKVFDENGINISNRGLGQNITGILDDEIEINLNEFYTASKDSYKEGWVIYPLSNLNPGRHTIKIKLWDTHNNSAESSVEFVVSANTKILFYEVYNYPNPMTNETTFYISHDRDGEELTLEFEIYSLSGALVRQQQLRYTDPDNIIDDIYWDGKDLRGVPVENGVYIYKFKLKSSLDEATNEIYRRLVISN